MYSRLECKTLNQETLRRKNRNKVPVMVMIFVFYMIPKAQATKFKNKQFGLYQAKNL